MYSEIWPLCLTHPGWAVGSAAPRDQLQRVSPDISQGYWLEIDLHWHTCFWWWGKLEHPRKTYMNTGKTCKLCTETRDLLALRRHLPSQCAGQWTDFILFWVELSPQCLIVLEYEGKACASNKSLCIKVLMFIKKKKFWGNNLKLGMRFSWRLTIPIQFKGLWLDYKASNDESRCILILPYI